MTSLSLDTLRETTGVFIAESAFQVIEMEYMDYLKNNQYSDNEVVAEQFIEEWKEKQKLLGTFTETSDRKIKYYAMDGEEEVNLSTMEFLNEMDMDSYHWENMCRRDWKVFKEILETGNVDKALLANILEEETISHEQIYQLKSAMENRVEELIDGIGE